MTQNTMDDDVAQAWHDFWAGLNFLLSHLVDRCGQEEEFLFPRNISTASTQGAQKTVDSLDMMQLYFQGALRQDCRVAAYPNYDRIAEKGLITAEHKPKASLLFIDLDLEIYDYEHLSALKKAVWDTLENIKENFIDGAVPTVMWTGGGVHVYLPLDSDYIPVFEELPEFAPFKDPSVKFMRYAEKKLTNSMSDKSHNVSFKSCMLRIPNSINTKYEGARGKVVVLQRWDGKRARPTNKFMLTDFHAYLVQEVIDKKIEELRMQRRRHHGGNNNNNKSANEPTISSKPWIEKLLQTPVENGRKTARDLILVPYLIVDKGLTDRNQIYDIVMTWADKCHELQRLKPSRSEFSMRLISRIDTVLDSDDKVPPMTLERTKQQCPELYKALIQDDVGLQE
jgi:hypothetical protein